MLHSIVGAPGVSHVSIAYETECGELRVSSMSSEAGRCVTRDVESFLRGTIYFIVIRPTSATRCRKAALRREATREWSYGLRARSPTHTFCTRHVRRQLFAAFGIELPFVWHPHSMLTQLRGERIVERGTPFAGASVCCLALLVALASLRPCALSRSERYD